MATPDVRVRLSAEGVAEVVEALRRIQGQAAKTAGAASTSFRGLNSTLGTIQRVLAGIGLVVSVASFVNLVREGSQLAESMQLAGVRIGTTTERASALALVAGEVDLEFGKVEGATARMNRQLSDAISKGGEAAEPFRQLKVPLKDLADLDTAERLEAIGKAFARFPAGPERSAIAVRIFGRAGQQLIPLLLQIANEGLAGVVARGRELGVVIEDDIARKTDRLNDRLTQFNLRLKVLAATFAAGLSGELVSAIDALDKELGELGPGRVEEFGRAVGRAIRFVVELHLLAVDAIKGTTVVAADALAALGRQFLSQFTLDFEKANRISEELGKRTDARLEAFRRRAERLGRILTSPGREVLFQRDKPAPAPGEDPEVERSRERLAAARAELDAELQLQKLRNKVRADQDKRAFDEGLIELSEFFRRRRVAIIAAAAQERAALVERRRLAEEEDDPAKRIRELTDVAKEAKRIGIERRAALADVAADERKAVRELGEERAEIDRRTLEAQGRRLAAARLAIDEEVRKRDEALRKAGAPPEERARVTGALRAALEAQAEFEERIDAISSALAGLDSERADVEARVLKGELTQREGAEELLRLERDRVLELRQVAAAALEAAAATGDPEAIARARELADEVERLRTATSKKFRDSAQQAIKSDLAEFFAEGVDQAENFGDAMRSLASSVIESIRRILAEILASRITFALIPGAAPTSKATKKHSGGPIWAPRAGGDVLVVAQEGERFIRREVAIRPREAAFLERFNVLGMEALRPYVLRLDAQKLHAGGPVGPAPATSQSVEVGGEVVVGLEEGLVERGLLTPRGSRAILRVVRRNRRAIQRMIG
ncbi:MAG TPA: hypothetical protein VJK66_01830 [Gaiellaceae bacterium]|nr:hypothetical protein [Gaiellaceae bacterium]